jgi:hypothetical protein
MKKTKQGLFISQKNIIMEASDNIELHDLPLWITKDSLRFDMLQYTMILMDQ